MRLLFYSGGDAADNQDLDAWLLRMLGSTNPAITVIPSCFDHREEDVQDFIDHYAPLGLQPARIFDADMVQSEAEIQQALAAPMVYLCGGNTFYFLASLRRQKLLKHLKTFAKEERVLAGKSAGAILMTPNINTAAVPEFDADENEEGIANLNALNLVGFEFFPHYRPQRAYDQEFCRYTRISNRPLYACPDGAGIAVYGSQISLVGDIAGFVDGRKFKIR